MNKIGDIDEAMANFLGIDKPKTRRVKRFWTELIQVAGPFVLEGLKIFQGSVHGKMNEQELKEYEHHITDLYNSQKDLIYKINEQMTTFMIDSERKNFQIKWLERSHEVLENNIKNLQSSFDKNSEETKKEIKSLMDMLEETRAKIKVQEEKQNKLINDVGDIKNKLKLVDEDIKYIKNEVAANTKNISDLQIQVKLNSISLNLNLLLSRFETEQKTLFEVIKNANSGFLDPYIITPLNLVEMVEKAQSMLPETTKFPFYPNFMNARKLYNLIEPTVYLYNNKILFILRIPVVNVKTFSIHKMTSLPFPVMENYFTFVLPKEPYLMIDLNDQEYTLLSSDNFREFCTKVNESLFLCQQIRQTSLAPLSTHCEVTLFLNTKNLPSSCNKRLMFSEKPIFLQLQETMSWIYAAPSTQNLIVTCGRQRNIVNLSGTGFLKLNRSCVARASNSELITIKQFTSVVSSNFLPQVNITHSAALSNVDEIKIKSDVNYREIIGPFDFKELEAMSVSTKIAFSSTKGVGHCGLSFLLFPLLLVAGI